MGKNELFLGGLIWLALLGACSKPASNPPKSATTQTAAVVVPVTKPTPVKVNVEPAHAKAKHSEPLDNDDYEEGPNLVAPPPKSLCWRDYCPCNPPQEGLDAKLCRRLKAGYPVDDAMLELGSMQRDYHESLADFHRQYPGNGY